MAVRALSAGQIVGIDRFIGATMTSQRLIHEASLDRTRFAATARRAGASSLGAGLIGLGLAFGVLTPLTGFIALTEAVAQERDADYSQFYDQLEEHGRWMEHPRWGYVWLPNADDGNWRPYTIGHWVNTEEHGWYWNSEEPWGWATYHYGRWVREDEEGWIWIPGREWAPAWVAWRESDDYMGWAPLPPEAEWEPGRGSLSFASSYYDSPRYEPYWIFVRPMHMVSPGLHRHIIPRSRAAFVLRNTTYVTNYSFVDRRVYNRGVRVNLVERGLNRSLPPVRIVSTDNHREHGFRPHGGEHRGEQRSGPSTGAVVAGVAAGVVALGVINVFRPKLAPRTAGGPPPAPRNVLPSASPQFGGRSPEGRPVRPTAAPVTPPPNQPPVLTNPGRLTSPPTGPARGQQSGSTSAPPGQLQGQPTSPTLSPNGQFNNGGQPSILRPPRSTEGQAPRPTPPTPPPAAPPVLQRQAPAAPPVLQRQAPPPQAAPQQRPPQQQPPAAVQQRPQPQAGAPQGQGRGQGQGGGQGQVGQKRNPNDPNQAPVR
jgi:hypothetical protein